MKSSVTHDVVKAIPLLVLAGLFWFVIQEIIPMALFMAGVAGGVALLWADKEYLFRYYQKPGESLYQNSYITRSLLFLIALGAAGVFVITSSGSRAGAGIVLGMGWWLASELWPYRTNLEQLNYYLGQNQKPLSLKELQWGWRGVYIWVIGLTIYALTSL